MSKRRHPELLREYLNHICRQSGAPGVMPWPDWLRVTVGGTLAVGATLGPVGCGGESSTGEAVSGAGQAACLAGDCTEDCSDGVDNDSDGSVDCDDRDCDSDPACAASGTGGTDDVLGSGGQGTGGTGVAYGIPFEDCTDGVDNDFDAQVDCDDADCNTSSACQGTGGVSGAGGDAALGGLGGTGGTPYSMPMEMNCDNAYDDDLDGLVDCSDPDCASASACSGSGGAAGGGGTGGDPGSGGIIGYGGSVYGVPLEDCTNGVDDNYNGLVDCDDPYCQSSTDCQGMGGASGAGGDPGIGGSSGAGADEGVGGIVGMGGQGIGGAYGVPYELNCTDGADEDFDGRADCDDPDCYDRPECTEAGGAGGEGGTAAVTCQDAAGICTAIPVVATPCARCDPTTALAHVPAPPSDSAMGCTVEGVGTSPLCCLPLLEMGDCENAGGGCYPPGNTTAETCPVGWNAVYTACPGGDTCCVPGPDCDDAG